MAKVYTRLPVAPAHAAVAGKRAKGQVSQPHIAGIFPPTSQQLRLQPGTFLSVGNK